MRGFWFTLTLILSGPALAIEVDTAAGLRAAIADAPAKTQIDIAAGEYDIADLKLPRDITLIGRGAVMFRSSRTLDKGLLNPVNEANIHIENIAFRGARSWDRNGAGIRHDGRDLTIVNCTFEDNENGILATGSENGRIRIRSASFLRNGHGDGYSHGIYAVRGQSLDIADSVFIGTRIGHHVKSLAARTRILDSRFNDADGRTSYAVDAQKGGDVLISRNSFTHAADADNAVIINYDLSRGGEARALVITQNRVLNHHEEGRLLRNVTGLEPVIETNEIENAPGAQLTLD